MSIGINLGNVKDFARGAAFLGTGGGGDPYIGRLMLQQELQRGRQVNIMSLDALPDDGLVVTCATMGAPTVMIEKIPSASATVAAIRQIEAALGRPVDAVMPAEAGGINATLPLVVGAMTGLPVVDADGMGRAFPELQMVTFGIYGCSASPLVLANDHGESATLVCSDNLRAERLARSLVIAMGGQAQIAVFPMSGRDAKRTSIAGTITAAVEIGQAIGEARARGLGPVESLLDRLDRLDPRRTHRLLFDGKIIDLRRETVGGFTRGKAVMAGLDGDDSLFEVMFQNENTIAYRDGRPVAMVPDLICVLDRETAEPITTEALKFGQRVKVVAWEAPASLTTETALAVVGPRAFDIDLTYVPLGSLGANVPASGEAPNA